MGIRGDGSCSGGWYTRICLISCVLDRGRKSAESEVTLVERDNSGTVGLGRRLSIAKSR